MELSKAMTPVLALIIASGMCLCGCGKQDATTMKSQFSSITVKQHYPVERSQVITNPDDITKLLAFFPGVGQGKRSSITGGWQALVVIDCVAADGTMVKVQSDYKSWTEGTGNGDWAVQGDLAKFIDELFAVDRGR